MVSGVRARHPCRRWQKQARRSPLKELLRLLNIEMVILWRKLTPSRSLFVGGISLWSMFKEQYREPPHRAEYFMKVRGYVSVECDYYATLSPIPFMLR
ncbi:hypothetical protein E2C01_007668 [Portunus trituberculatus]|uniref:Uncharacterized protein n=1 Tax=Portunus trituberculatus TaxID=210409 RepID=A0A5B7CZV4_PORTR|nr:hypothetical protein [Portunus trituberculatus]